MFPHKSTHRLYSFCHLDKNIDPHFFWSEKNLSMLFSVTKNTFHLFIYVRIRTHIYLTIFTAESKSWRPITSKISYGSWASIPLHAFYGVTFLEYKAAVSMCYPLWGLEACLDDSKRLCEEKWHLLFVLNWDLIWKMFNKLVLKLKTVLFCNDSNFSMEVLSA